jgi:tetratricopeptide (TPR) repeat protein
MPFFERQRYSYSILLLLVIFTYLPSVSGGFLLDDHHLIETNPLIHTRQSLDRFFLQEDGIVPERSWKSSHTGYYRPLVNLTYRMDYLLWGMNPGGFRTTNMILHLMTCIMLFRVLCFLFKDNRAALWTACIFALHTTNTEAVSWISSRNNILVTFFALNCIFFFARYCEDNKPARLALSALSFALSVFTKEFGLTLLPILSLYWWTYSKKKASLADGVKTWIPYGLVVCVYFLLRKEAIGSWLTLGDHGGLLQRVHYAPYLISWHLRLILMPARLHSFAVGYPDGYLNWQAIAGFLCLAGFFFAIWKCKARRLIRFALLSFLISLIPILNVVKFSSVTLVSMRWVYFPLIFASILFGRMISVGFRSRIHLRNTILVSVSLYLGIYTFMLNKYLWQNEYAFYSTEIKQFDNAHYYGGWAETLYSGGDPAEAEIYFKKALADHPNTAKNHINYAALLIERGQAADAVALLLQAENLPMDKKERAEWHNNLGTAFFKRGDFFRAIGQIQQAIALDPNHPYLWANLGAGYFRTGDLNLAVETLREGLDKFPHSIDLKKKLAVLYLRIEESGSALPVLDSIPREKWEGHGIGQLYEKAKQTAGSLSTSAD